MVNFPDIGGHGDLIKKFITLDLYPYKRVYVLYAKARELNPNHDRFMLVVWDTSLLSEKDFHMMKINLDAFRFFSGDKTHLTEMKLEQMSFPDPAIHSLELFIDKTTLKANFKLVHPRQKESSINVEFSPDADTTEQALSRKDIIKVPQQVGGEIIFSKYLFYPKEDFPVATLIEENKKNRTSNHFKPNLNEIKRKNCISLFLF